MKLLFIIDSLNSGGAQRQIVMLANYLHTHKACEVEIMTYVEGNHYKEMTDASGLRISCIKKKSRFDILLIYKLVKYVRKGKFNIVCAFLFTPGFYALLIKLFLFRKIKVLVSERTYEGYLDTIGKITRFLYPVADYITANSETQTAILKAKYPKLSKKIYFMKNGVDTEKFKVQYDTYKPLQVVSIGRVEKLKNPMCLIEAMNLLKKQYQIEIKVKWAGNVHNSEEGRLFLKQCDDALMLYGLQQNWNWLGVVKDIQTLLQESEMLVHPSFGEGFPNTICEAMACGKVIFASAVNDHPIIMKEGFNGYLFDPLKPKELAEKIHSYTLLPKDDKLQVMKNARLFAEEEFSYKQQGDSFYNLLS